MIAGLLGMNLNPRRGVLAVGVLPLNVETDTFGYPATAKRLSSVSTYRPAVTITHADPVITTARTAPAALARNLARLVMARSCEA